MKIVRFVRDVLIGVVVGLFCIHVLPAYLSGLYYAQTGEHYEEQQYLDQCIVHLEMMRAFCDDPDLNGVLDYATRRYSRIGPWDVMIFPLAGPNALLPKDWKVVGCNVPWCPGITLDPSLLLESPEETALVIAHEAMHDYWPYYGHAHITPRERKLRVLSNHVLDMERTWAWEQKQAWKRK